MLSVAARSASRETPDAENRAPSFDATERTTSRFPRWTRTSVVDSLIDGITQSLKKGDSITFVGFGTFKTAQRKARTARNPQTGAAIKVPKRRVVRFSAGKALKEHVR